MAKRNNSASKSNTNTNGSVPLKIQVSRKLPNGEWTSTRIGVAFKSKCGNKLHLKFNALPTCKEDELVSVWLTPYEGDE